MLWDRICTISFVCHFLQMINMEMFNNLRLFPLKQMTYNRLYIIQYLCMLEMLLHVVTTVRVLLEILALDSMKIQ